jgi:DNA-binding SARP family transcriptional activator
MATADTPTQGAIRLHLLGDPKLETGAGRLSLERKDAALLALLAIEQAVPRGRMAALLWPDADAAAARNNLRQRLHRLRKRAGREVADTANDVLRLAAHVSHDLGGLTEALADDVAAAGGEPLGALDYADCEALDAWVNAAREQWRAARRDALAEISSRQERDGRLALALEYAQRLVADDPLLEHAHRRLMRLHYLRGDRGAALSAFERCRERLSRELGASPGRETLALAAMIDASGALPPAPAPKTAPLVLPRPARLVGRDTEWRLLEQACDARRLMLVCGEPGMGKSRLLTDFAAGRAGMIVVGARPGDARVPYVLMARLLRAVLERHPSLALDDPVRQELARLLPEFGAAAPRAMQPPRLRQAVVAALLTAAPALGGCVIDDLHFADEASQEMVLAIAASEAGRSLQWLMAVRATQAVPPLASRLAHADAADLECIELAPLDASAVESLLASLALPGFDARPWAEPLARHTGGNPLFVLETLSALLARGGPVFSDAALSLPAPGSVGQLIERRLEHLSPEALRLARAAALAGPDFSVELVARVLRVHPLDLAGAWRELEATQVIRDGAFAHDLVFEATLHSVPEPIARVLHLDIAAELDASGAPAARVAQHWHDAQEWARAGAAFAAAAQRACRLSQPSIEADLWLRAADCFDRSGATEEARAARSRGQRLR